MGESADFALIATPTATGFPSPADDYAEKKLDLNEYLIRNRQAVFFLRVQGSSMVGAGIHDGDLLIVDRSMPALHKKIVVAVVQGELLIRRLLRHGDKISLSPESSNQSPNDLTIAVTPDLDFQIWGVATSVIHTL